VALIIDTRTSPT